MKIYRKGSAAYHGTKSIEVKANSINWNSKHECIVLTATEVSDFSTNSHHDYEFQIPIAEFAECIDAIGETATNESPGIVAALLSPRMSSILRIIATCIGLIKRR